MYKFLNRSKPVCLILGLVFLKIILLGCGKQPRLNPTLSANKIRINDVSQLNPTDVSQITNANQVKDLQRAIRLAKDNGLKISIAGKRHSQGGHAFYDEAVVLNMENFNQILDFQPEMKTIIEVPKSGCLKTKKEESAMKNKTTSQSNKSGCLSFLVK